MAILNQAANLNLIPGTSAQVVVHLSQANVGDTLTFYLYSGSEPFAETGMAVALNGIRKDGVGFTAPCIIVGNVVTVTVTESMTALSGYALAELVITDGGGNSVGTANFALAIEEGTFPNGPTYDTDISVYQQILQYVQSYPAMDQARIDAAVDAAATAERVERAAEDASIRANITSINSTLTESVRSEVDARQNTDAELLERINAEVVARGAEDASLQAQINQIVAPSGEAPSAAEVENARIGSDGYTYSSLGNAIRTQDSDLNMAVSKLTDCLVLKNAVARYQTADNWRLNESDGLSHGNDKYSLVKFKVTPGELLYVECNDRMQFQTVASVPSTGTSNKVGDTYIAYAGLISVPDTANYLVMSCLKNGGVANCYLASNRIDATAARDLVPTLINGSALNHYNVNAVTPKVVLPLIPALEELYAIYTGEFPDGAHIIWSVQGFTSEAIGMDAIEAQAAGYMVLNIDQTRQRNERAINLLEILPSTAKAFSVAPFVFKEDGGRIPLRIATHQHCIRIWQEYIGQSVSSNSSVSTELNNARHISGFTVAPLTICHFSDLHADEAAMSRIVRECASYGGAVDDIICTGDMVANSAESITAWWNQAVMTCIGNHDTASYSESAGYNWAALSMADRDAYYIAPFIGSWGSAVHTSGTSYYYKDYAAQKVRMIVMDVMLYMSDTTAAEASAQTSWLTSLLSNAITNGYHVLIAIHCPHGGATAKDCSFSRYGQGVMPTYEDCDTPQTIINAVATAINNGLHFIGYIVGHTHQDNMWDATGDGTQMMYCVTCAAVAQTAQWRNSDQYRNASQDAYNLISIDTANTLVKIVRGGGADIDNHMRTRKGIAFNYSTGEIVGQVL